MGLSRMSEEPVEEAIVQDMLEAANWAPSHGDTEPWRFQVFTGDGRHRLAEVFSKANPDTPEGREGARKRAFAAPVWISIAVSPGLDDAGELVMTMDEELMAVACAVQNLHLVAQAHGLAGMWHSKGPSVHPGVAEALGLARHERLLGFFMCGWPNGEWLSATRRPLDEKVIWHK